jgi:hypothetical protein
MTKELISKRYEELAYAMNQVGVTQHPNGWEEVNVQRWNEWVTSVLNLVNASFGADSIHFKQVTRAMDSSEKHGMGFAVDSAKGAFLAARADFAGGYVSTLAQGIAGEVSSSLLNSARTALKEGSKDSAAVLASAAFEDSLKKIGTLQNMCQSNSAKSADQVWELVCERLTLALTLLRGLPSEVGSPLAYKIAGPSTTLPPRGLKTPVSFSEIAFSKSHFRSIVLVENLDLVVLSRGNRESENRTQVS